ncbi:7853_t:CDS:2, partial [Gigaspora rosea]
DSNKEDRDKAKNRIVKVNEDVNMMIDKNVSNNESKCDSSKSGLENENARKTNIESNESIGEEKE